MFDMKSVMGIISLHGKDDLIKDLAEDRPIGSIPIAGRYRIVDFALSSMVNSGISNVGVMLSDKSRSILDHIRSGKDWDLARHHGGLTYLPMVRDLHPSRGNLKTLYNNLEFVENSAQRYVILARGDMVYNMNFTQVLRYHQNTGADITMVYNVEAEDQPAGGVVIETAANGLIKDIARKPVSYAGSKLAMGVFLMDKRKFVDCVRSSYEHGGIDFLLDGIIRRLHEYNIYGYEHDGYVARINSMAAYYQASMELLHPEVWEGLFMGDDPIYTKSNDAIPAQYKAGAAVRNSLVANGCVVRGEVENSILFRGVVIGADTKVKNSIIMQGCEIKDEALLENVICDKNVVITKEKWLKGADNYPLVIRKNMVI